MDVMYHVPVDDPGAGRKRLFVREADEWPFPNLPAPGDAVTVDIAAPGARLLSVTPRRVEYVIYSPNEAIAYLVCPATQPTDPELQVEKLLAAGFVEVDLP
jgi:hypothetical protein